MSKGSKRVTIRIGEELLRKMHEAVDRRNNRSNAAVCWSVSEFVVQAVVDKLNHDLRSARKPIKIRQVKTGENTNRDVTIDYGILTDEVMMLRPDPLLTPLHSADDTVCDGALQD